MAPLWPVVLGFLLTTVLGGFLGSLFQRRVWNHQHITQLADSERKRSVEIFEEVSRLLDKRLYRLRLLYWSLPVGNSLGERSELAEQRMSDYRAVLYDWNDGINRNLALIQQYFGDDARYEFDNVIGIYLIDLGRVVENLWNGSIALDQGQKAQFEGQLQLLSELIYHYNIKLLQKIRADHVVSVKEDARGPGERRSLPSTRRYKDGNFVTTEIFQRPQHIQAAFRRAAGSQDTPASPTYLPQGSTYLPQGSAEGPPRNNG